MWCRWENTTLISLIPSHMWETPNCETTDSLRPAINTSSENHGFTHSHTHTRVTVDVCRWFCKTLINHIIKQSLGDCGDNTDHSSFPNTYYVHTFLLFSSTRSSGYCFNSISNSVEILSFTWSAIFDSSAISVSGIKTDDFRFPWQQERTKMAAFWR